MELFCGIDWAEAHHDIALVDADGNRIAKIRIGCDAGGFGELLTLLASGSVEPSSIPIAIETDKNLIVVALQGAGFTVYAINPKAVARYRERHHQAGGKSDPGDAFVLANILRTDMNQHRPMPQISDSALAVRALARQHQEAIWARQLTVNRLRTVLLEFYPNALAAFPILTHKAALEILGKVPTPAQALRLNHSRMVALLRRSGRGDRPGLGETILSKLQTPALRQAPGVESALGHAVVGLISIIKTMESSIADLENAMGAEFQAHSTSRLFAPVPGLGPVLGARVLAEIGDDRSRFSSANGLRAFAGTAPITRASGRSKMVRTRHIKNKRLANACQWWAFAAITKSDGARAHYDRRRAVGDTHNAALRNLANKLLGRLWWCIVNDVEWNEEAAWPASSDAKLNVAA
jgi:transposase